MTVTTQPLGTAVACGLALTSCSQLQGERTPFPLTQDGKLSILSPVWISTHGHGATWPLFVALRCYRPKSRARGRCAHAQVTRTGRGSQVRGWVIVTVDVSPRDLTLQLPVTCFLPRVVEVVGALSHSGYQIPSGNVFGAPRIRGPASHLGVPVLCLVVLPCCGAWLLRNFHPPACITTCPLPGCPSLGSTHG